MARTFKTLVLTALITLASASFALTAPNDSQPINGIVAIVNNTPIMQSQVDAMMQTAGQGPDQPTKAMALQALINQTLQLDIAKKAGVSVSDADVNGAIAHIAKQNQISVAQLKSKVTQGMSWADYKNEIKKQMTMSKIQQQATAGKVSVSNAQIAAFIKNHSDQLGVETKYQYSDLLIPTSAQVTNAQATGYAKTVIASWKPGVKLASLVAKVPAKVGVSMSLTDSWQTPDNIPDVFLSALRNMKNGALSSPIVTGNGVHVLQLDKKQMASAALQKQRASQILMQQAFLKAVKQWVTNLKKTAYIKIVTPQN